MTQLRENHYRQLELIASYNRFGLAINDPHNPRGGRALSLTLEAHGLVEFLPMMGGIVEWEHAVGNTHIHKYCTWQITRKGKSALKEWQQKHGEGFEPIRIK